MSKKKKIVRTQIFEFFDTLLRTTEEERRVIFSILCRGCPADLPDNIHINIDLLRRLTGYPVAKIKRILSRLASLGFWSSLREDHETEGHLGNLELIVLEWHNMTTDELTSGNATAVADAMVKCVAEEYCAEHAMDALLRLDFSSLCSATATPHTH